MVRDLFDDYVLWKSLKEILFIKVIWNIWWEGYKKFFKSLVEVFLRIFMGRVEGRRESYGIWFIDSNGDDKILK